MDFYAQAVRGQWEISRKSRPNSTVLADPRTPAKVRKRITEVETMRRFATEHLDLPGGDAYGKYAELGREHLVWVIHATPEFSLEPKQWWYPFVGKLDYRGYFDEAAAEATAADLRVRGYDTYVGGVDAYSTLGHFHDPLLDTFLFYPELHLAETIFHELAHHRVFVPGGTEYNECLANVVAEEGVKHWLASQRRTADLQRYEGLLKRRTVFYSRVKATRRKLAALYHSGLPEAEMRREKKKILAALRTEFRELFRKWGARKIEGWLDGEINNAHLASLKLYAARMPQIRAIFRECGEDFPTFFRRIDPRQHQVTRR